MYMIFVYIFHEIYYECQSLILIKSIMNAKEITYFNQSAS